jgi:predicted Ser/Thr protein kinase
MTLRTSTPQVTGGSIRPPPPPVQPSPHSDSPLHIATPGLSTLAGVGAALLVGVGALVMLTRPREAAAVPVPEGGPLREPREARGSSGRMQRPGTRQPSGVMQPPPMPEAGAGPAVSAAAAAGDRFRAVIETSDPDANPMGRTQSVVFEPTGIYAPGQVPAAPQGKSSGVARRPAPSPATRQPPASDAAMETSKMNRTLPPYQPSGVQIRRAKKPPPPPAAPVNIPPGVLPDRYRVTSILGKGGMGVVYKAFDCQGNREVAVKTLGADVMSTDTARERFVREYETLNALSHPNIIKVYDMGCVTTPYFAMEFVDGEDLGTIMLDDNLSPEAVLEIGIQLSNALEYAHTEGVYHRDIKPSNLMISPDGLLKIVDFGLVKDTHASSLTMDGTVLGSLRFMAPEQLAAAPVDARSDVYAAGMTLYYLLSGATPFDGHNPVVKLGQEPSSVLLHAPGADKRLAFAIDRSIRKEAKDRWQNARELEDALRAVKL